MKISKETRNKIKQYVLDGINNEEYDLKTPEEKLIYAYGRFKSEYSYMIGRVGIYRAFSEWLQGLALNYDFYNYDILNLAKQWEQPLKTEREKEKILNSWWSFLTNYFFKLCREYKINMEVKK